jgi:hypothetical protein
MEAKMHHELRLGLFMMSERKISVGLSPAVKDLIGNYDYLHGIRLGVLADNEGDVFAELLSWVRLLFYFLFRLFPRPSFPSN